MAVTEIEELVRTLAESSLVVMDKAEITAIMQSRYILNGMDYDEAAEMADRIVSDLNNHGLERLRQAEFIFRHTSSLRIETLRKLQHGEVYQSGGDPGDEVPVPTVK